MAELSFQNFSGNCWSSRSGTDPMESCMLCQLDLTSELRFLLIMAHCSFGGVCALFQTKCMIRSQNWSFPRYIAEKLLPQGTSLFACCIYEIVRIKNLFSLSLVRPVRLLRRILLPVRVRTYPELPVLHGCYGQHHNIPEGMLPDCHTCLCNCSVYDR